MADGLLETGDCVDPTDLAGLTSLIYNRTNSQAEVVFRFPLAGMRQATPNHGHKLLVALMAERAITHVMTLNFDLAVENAASQLGNEIQAVDRPEQLVPACPSVIYLHGNVSGHPDTLILRAEAIDDEWRGTWQQIVAQQILSAPNVLFVGLGSAAPVLTATVDMICAALGGTRTTYQADRAEHGQNQFAEQLAIPPDRYIKATWTEVLTALANRVADEQLHSFRSAGIALLSENHATDEDRDAFEAMLASASGASLLCLGRLRAFGKLDHRRQYIARTVEIDEAMTEPVTKLGFICAELGLTAKPTNAGIWAISRGDRIVFRAVLASAGGARVLEAMQIRAARLCREIDENTSAHPDLVLIGGTTSDSAPVAHMDLIHDEEAGDILGGPSRALILSANDPDLHAKAGALLNAA